MDAIFAAGLTKTYKNEVRALSGLSFSARQGSVFALIGPNGAGKSTTVKILTTLARQDSGTAIVAGYDVRHQSNQVRHCIGTVSQQHISDPYSTGCENLLFHGHIHGIRGKKLQRRVGTLLERFDLAAAAHRMVGEYSGGMRRRLDIALGLIHEPIILFLDEPTTGLDPNIRTRMWDDISGVSREGNVTVVLTSHNLEEVERVADHVAIIQHGRVAAEGTPDFLKSRLGGGDAIVIELDREVTELHTESLLRTIPAIRDAQPDRTTLRMRTANGGAMMPSILDCLRDLGLRVQFVKMTTPTLDDVYRVSDSSHGPVTAEQHQR